MNDNHPKSIAAQISHLEAETDALRNKLEEMREIRRKRDLRKLILLGLAISIPFHLMIIAYLASYRMGGSGEGFDEGEGIEFTVLSSNELREMQEEIEVEEVSSSEIEVDDSLSSMLSVLDEQMAAASITDLDVDGAMPSPGGVIGFSDSMNSDSGLMGSASFFGIGSRGRRFGFIIDISTSMSNSISRAPGSATKFDQARANFLSTIDSLPDYTQVYVLLFAGTQEAIKFPAFQKSWLPMSERNKERLSSWLARQAPKGGTAPYEAFKKVFSLRNRPDVIYFLTDGKFEPTVPGKIAELNKKGRRVVINTIALGAGAAPAQLEKIARESGGRCVTISGQGRGRP